jgi:tetratricopeptide (TPR) repeat protein
MRRIALLLVVVVVVLWLAAPSAHAKGKAPVAKTRSEASGYLEELEKRGLVDKTLGTPERLAAEVRAADDDLVAGNPTLAAARLYGVVEGPRYQDLNETEDFQDAEYRLGLALHRGGGSESARRYFARALQRGPKAPFYQASLRAYVDVCLDARILPLCVAELDRLSAEDMLEEIGYLRGRAAFEAGISEEAESELKRVSPKSRFYSSALYLRGVMRVKQKDLRGAQDAFCSIADVKDGDSIRFYIDGRYYALRDLARLALGRVAHEEGRYDDAFYHYFLIPQDSNRLGEALFEAAWSSLQRKEYDLGARLVAEFLKTFPRSPRAAEAKLLLATLQVKTCRFGDAEKGFSTFLTANEPLIAQIDRVLADAGARTALAVKLLARAESPTAAELDADGQYQKIAELLEVDAKFFRLQALARGLRNEALDAAHVTTAWGQLAAKIGGTPVQAVGSGLLDPTALQGRIDGLAGELVRARASLRQKIKSAGRSAETDEIQKQLEGLEGRRRELASTLARSLDMQELRGGQAVEGAGGLLPLVRADSEHAGELQTRTGQLSTQLERASGELVRQALVDLRAHLEDLLRRARLGKIDAVVGQKRKLERQIEDLAAGRFPPEMFGKLHIEGLIRDDEEYWPPEKEIWLDEYENYK